MAFVVRLDSQGLHREVLECAGAVASVLQRLGGIKAWEGYLLVLVDGLSQLPPEDQAEVQRDLTYCRRILIDAQRVELDVDNSLSYLMRELALLFPLSASEVGDLVEVNDLLIDELVRRGNERTLVTHLVRGLDASEVDGLSTVSDAVSRAG